ncbi:V4R domain-containing protein [Methanohalophilus halophilus]|uniref:ArsR family transcriptional regulator n=1 Tax=Methanohalophilus halophilus TaxID=2177 RepID=A0A1L3Q3G0_9EURY|nr:V4R domain-containing protein [Methanohalophilus halophilus]APH39399.1 hypothetical protein BHR79_07835 [Methanohalophilus halophilus]RNI07690.1 ArsR family transcriptional regulator [Methanohalophilus halophilus]SDW95937.1 hypothetical protein SAMN04515625_1943 [Methanohalophilus halophilus]
MNATNRTALFATNNGFIAINGAVKLQIMDLLDKRPCTFDEIVQTTGKAKSTVSVHLNDLKKANLLRESVDTLDRRKKNYNLSSKYVACSQKPLDTHYYHSLENFSSTFSSETDFFQNVFCAFKAGFEAQGIDHNPIVKHIGSDIGTQIANTFEQGDFLDSLEEVRSFWKCYKLGKVQIEDTDPLTIKVKDCFECMSMPVLGHPICSFDEGMLEGILYKITGERPSIKETECYATGDNHCLFIKL